MSSRALSSLWGAASEGHTADPVARSTPSTSDHRTTQRRAGTPSGLEDTATAPLGDALMSPWPDGPYPMACGTCWLVHPVGACDRWSRRQLDPDDPDDR